MATLATPSTMQLDGLRISSDTLIPHTPSPSPSILAPPLAMDPAEGSPRSRRRSGWTDESVQLPTPPSTSTLTRHRRTRSTPSSPPAQTSLSQFKTAFYQADHGQGEGVGQGKAKGKRRRMSSVHLTTDGTSMDGESIKPHYNTRPSSFHPSLRGDPHSPRQRAERFHSTSSLFPGRTLDDSVKQSRNTDDLLERLRASFEKSPRQRSSRLSSSSSTPPRLGKSTKSSSRSSTPSTTPPTSNLPSGTSSPTLSKSSTLYGKQKAITFPRARSILPAQTASSIASALPVQQALAASVYVLVTLIAMLTLISILAASYGLTLADDVRSKIGYLGKRVELGSRKIMLDLGEGVKALNEQLKARRSGLENTTRKESANPSPSSKSDPSAKPHHPFLKVLAQCNETIGTHLGFQIPLFKEKSKPSPRPPYTTPPSSRSSTHYQQDDSSSTSQNRNKLPPRPPLRSLIPSIFLALLLALIALLRTRSKSRKATGPL